MSATLVDLKNFLSDLTHTSLILVMYNSYDNIGGKIYRVARAEPMLVKVFIFCPLIWSEGVIGHLTLTSVYPLT